MFYGVIYIYISFLPLFLQHLYKWVVFCLYTQPVDNEGLIYEIGPSKHSSYLDGSCDKFSSSTVILEKQCSNGFYCNLLVNKLKVNLL